MPDHADTRSSTEARGDDPEAPALGHGALPDEPDGLRAPATRWRGLESPDVRFGVAAGVALLAVIACWVLLVGTEAGQRLENSALRGAELRTELDRQAALDRLSQVTTTAFALAVIGCFVIGQLRKRGWLATVVVASMGIGVVAAELLKAVLDRPALVDGPVWILRNSFPSGSAAVASAVALGIYLVVPDRVRWLALVVGVVGAGLISEAVQTSGWHRLSDTIGAAGLAIAAIFGGLWLLARVGLVVPSERGRVDARLSAGLSLVAMVALALGVLVLMLLALFPLLATPVDSRRALLQTAFPLIGTGWTIVAIVSAARVVEPFALGVAGHAADDPRKASATRR